MLNNATAHIALDLDPTRHTRTAETNAVLLLEVDIAKPIPSVLFLDLHTGKRYTRGLLLVRMYTYPIGMIDLESTNFQIMPHDLAAIIWDALWREINTALKEEGLPVVDGLDAFGLPPTRTPITLIERDHLRQHAPLVSIIVCTHNRPQQITTCLDALKRLDYPGGFEIIVVDSAPTNDATAQVIAADYADDVLYLHEPQPGISNARNRGLAQALGEIIAFTDDDAIVEPNWLIELLRGFYAAEHVGGVMGLTLPDELETEAQVWYQQERGERGFVRQVFDIDDQHSYNPLTPFRAPVFGAGMNMAFRASLLREIGGFDPALGIGTATHSGEDMAAFFEVLLRGYQLAYEPGAIVYHNHRETYTALREQIYGFGVGCSAYLTRILRHNPRLLFRLLGRLPLSLIAGLLQNPNTPRRPRRARPLFWIELRVLEWCGFVRGPLAYRRSRRLATG